VERFTPLPRCFAGGHPVPTLSETNRILVQTDKIKNPPRYEDIAGQEALNAIPSGWRVLTVLLCMMVALCVAFLLLKYL
jgi:hypothetical protein